MAKLTPDQCEAVLRAARPLSPADNAAFVDEVVKTLADVAEIGDGIVHRVIRDLQRKYFDPPDLRETHLQPYRR